MDDDLTAPEPDPQPAIQPDPLPVAGAVSTVEELASLQQIAIVAGWMRRFTAATRGLPVPPSPQD